MRRRQRDDKLERLSRIPAFASLTWRQLLVIGALADEVYIREGTVLARQGWRPTEVLFVLEGRIKMERDGTTTVAEGGLVGGEAVAENIVHRQTVVTEGPVRALVFDLRSFGRLVDELPDVLRRADSPAQDAVATTGVPAVRVTGCDPSRRPVDGAIRPGLTGRTARSGDGWSPTR